MTKKALALEVIGRLKQAYPLAECTLDYEHAWQLLVEVRLAAQCTDARVNIVVQELFAKYPGVKALADATPEEIEAIVKPCGLGRSKARDISLCMRKLRDEYNCQVPDDFDALLGLPGVGRKSAASAWWTTSGSPKRSRWPCGRSFLPKRATICATGSCSTAAPCATPAGPTVRPAAWPACAKPARPCSRPRPPKKSCKRLDKPAPPGLYWSRT